MIIAISLTLGLITGCTNKVSDTNEKIYTIEQISSIKEDLSKKISESIENSGLRVVENKSDGSFVLSLGNLSIQRTT